MLWVKRLRRAALGATEEEEWGDGVERTRRTRDEEYRTSSSNRRRSSNSTQEQGQRVFVDDRGRTIILHKDGHVELLNAASEAAYRSFQIQRESLDEVRSACLAGGRLLLCMESPHLLLVDTRITRGEVAAMRVKLPLSVDTASANMDEDLIALTSSNSVHMCFPTHDHQVERVSCLSSEHLLSVDWLPRKPRALRAVGTDSGQRTVTSQMLLLDPHSKECLEGQRASITFDAKVTGGAGCASDSNLYAIMTEDACFHLIDLRSSRALRKAQLPSPALAASFHPSGGLVTVLIREGKHEFDLLLEGETRSQLFATMRSTESPLKWLLSDLPGEGKDAWLDNVEEEGTSEEEQELVVVLAGRLCGRMSIDLGKLAFGRIGLQEICASWIRAGEVENAIRIMRCSEGGRQRQTCASLIVNFLLRDERGLRMLCSDALRRKFFLSLSQGEWESCEEIVRETKDEQLTETLYFWAGQEGNEQLQGMEGGVWEEERDRMTLKPLWDGDFAAVLRSLKGSGSADDPVLAGLLLESNGQFSEAIRLYEVVEEELVVEEEVEEELVVVES
ncbi:hypothetical protein GUITHDRAFT_132226 [Guillardia theta CCMP2712]|uniref:Uncharacterized protein n=1 Tax=Guillardia theta (strain CCMP2712) TaxID=905079 RepID=L1K1Q7_GUITC|nr:hypothetical protein GUITHDRAFT_132226 [Guillardia theta CCMP2712]EKX54514.1 hypothetical protein GUITHDRAFT_132226 [Guillardia theta CCMP2712]|eukprot:XP_005841494.1 hypothetical protein GUITHDRAFT_132226 [Guillardia theta CCMP2712]